MPKKIRGFSASRGSTAGSEGQNSRRSSTGGQEALSAEQNSLRAVTSTRPRFWDGFSKLFNKSPKNIPNVNPRPATANASPSQSEGVDLSRTATAQSSASTSCLILGGAHDTALIAPPISQAPSPLTNVGGGLENAPPSEILITTQASPMIPVPTITVTLETHNVQAAPLSTPSTNPLASPSQLPTKPLASTRENLIKARSASVWEKTLEIAKQKLIDNKLPPLDLDKLAEGNIQCVIKGLETAHANAAAKQLRYEWQGREIIVVERLGKILKVVQGYKDIVDVGMQLHPVTTLVWAGVTTGFQVCTTPLIQNNIRSNTEA